MLANIRDQILSAQDIKEEDVPVPEWDVKVHVKGLTGAERNRILKKSIDSDGSVDLDAMYPDLLIGTVYDPEDGEKVFGEKDRDALNAKSGAAIERVAQVAMKLSGLDENAQDVKLKN